MFLPRLLSCLVATALLGSVNLHADEVYAVTDNSAPTEDLLISFDQGTEAGGWGWYFLNENTRRDIALSFAAPSGGSFDKVTLKIRRLRGGAITEQPYQLRILEADSAGTQLSEAREVASYQTTINLDPANDFYVTFTLPKPVETQANSYYFVVLSWENGADSNHLEFAVQNQYTMGSLWQKSSEGGPEFTRLTDSDRPGLIFYIH